MDVNRFIRKQPCKVNRNFYSKPIFSIVGNKTDMLRLVNLYCQSTDEVFEYFGEYISSELNTRYIEEEDFFIGSEIDMFELTSDGSAPRISAEVFPQFYVDEHEIEFDLEFYTGPYVFCTYVQESFDRFGDTNSVFIYKCKSTKLYVHGIAT